jgi:hypothetical protein
MNAPSSFFKSANRSFGIACVRLQAKLWHNKSRILPVREELFRAGLLPSGSSLAFGDALLPQSKHWMSARESTVPASGDPKTRRGAISNDL